ncbi:MAG: hypothetical protein U0903_11525 [Planctomycetales bacterium]
MSTNNFQDETRLNVADGTEIATQRNMWGMMGLGLAIGLLGMNLLVANPMLDEMQMLQREVALLKHEMHDLVGVRGDIRNTNTLLSSLKEQAALVAEARAVVNSVRELQDDLIQERENSLSARHALDELVGLQEKVLDQREYLVPGQKAIESIASMHDRLVDLGHNSGIDTAIQGLVDLKNRVMEYTADLSSAQVALTDLIGLKNMALVQGNDTELARQKLAKTVELNAELAKQTSDIEMASRNLQSLLQIKDKLLGQTKDIADAVQNIEILTSFNDEFQKQVRSLEGMRQGLMEIVMMETTIGRVTRILEPIAQIGNMRGLSEVEVREAARKILEKRAANISQKADTLDKPAASKAETGKDVAVPQPKD